MELKIGKLVLHGDHEFTLPQDAVARTFAIMGQRGSGKSSLATVMAEEMCKAGLPWMALDPVGVWWGLRAKADGTAGGFPVVVFGGERGDIPLEKGQGRKIAEACVEANVFAVIDLSRDSKTTWRTVVKDFCLALQDLRPHHPRHVFIEEAPEFVPQRASHQLGAECKEIVERLVRLGRNWGYGATVLTQRPATVDKDVLSQCESLFVMRTSGKHDRKALGEWIEARASEAELERVLGELASLADGAAWYWSPQWMKQFVRVQVRRRETFHPGETRTVGDKVKSVEMVDVQSFVEKVRKQLTKTAAAVPGESKIVKSAHAIAEMAKNPELKKVLVEANAGVQKALGESSAREKDLRDDVARLALENGDLRRQLREEQAKNNDLTARIQAVRSHLRPQYQVLAHVMGEIPDPSVSSAGAVDAEVWEPWLKKAGSAGCRRMLEILINKREMTRAQLGTLSGVPSTKTTFRDYLSWLRRNNLIETDGDKVRLKAV